MTRKTLLGSIVLAALLCCGSCEEYDTTIVLKPKGTDLVRVMRPAADDPHRADVMAYYQAADPNAAQVEQTVSGNFANHLGGTGSYRTLQSPLGSACFYSEQFLGTGDLLQDLQAWNHKIDTAVDLVDGWVTHTLADTPQYAQVRRFINTEYRRDLKNLLLIVHQVYSNMNLLSSLEHDGQIEISDETEEILSADFAVRVFQYAVQKEYLVPEADLPLLERSEGSLLGLSDSASGNIDVLIRQNLKRRFGYTDAQIDPVLDAEAFEAYVRTVPVFVKFQQAERLRRQDPAYTAEMNEFVEAVFGNFDFFADSDQVNIRLETGVEPLQTNGRWNEEKGTVLFNGEAVARSDLPKTAQQVYAFWAVPEDTAQRARFGRVLLEKEPLVDYCLWYKGLGEPDRGAWDAFLSMLQPPAGQPANAQVARLITAVEAFAFPPAEGEDEQQTARRHKGKDIVLKALRGLSDTPPTNNPRPPEIEQALTPDRTASDDS